jgi:hypothetical protein
MATAEQSDTFDASGVDGAPIRSKYVIQRAPAHFILFSPFGYLSDDDNPLLTGWCGAVWTKNTKYESSSSDVRSELTLWMDPYVASYGDLAGNFVYYRDNLDSVGVGIIRNTYLSSVGLFACDVIELGSQTDQTVKYSPDAAFDVVNGRREDHDVQNVFATVLPFFDNYEMFSHAMVKPSKGDMVVMVLDEDCPDLAEGDTFELRSVANGVRITTRVVTVERHGSYHMAYVTQ